MADSKHYGIVSDIAEGEPDAATGDLSVSSVLASGVNSVASMVVVGSTASSPIDLAQLVLTPKQAYDLGALLTSAAHDAVAADHSVDWLRKYGPAAARLCFALASADANDVLLDQSRVRLGYPIEAQAIAEAAYEATDITNGDWRAAWRLAGERLRKETGK